MAKNKNHNNQNATPNVEAENKSVAASEKKPVAPTNKRRPASQKRTQQSKSAQKDTRQNKPHKKKAMFVQ